MYKEKVHTFNAHDTTCERSECFVFLLKLVSLFFFLQQSLMTRQLPMHPLVGEHEQSRSYQPSSTGIAAYYQVGIDN